MEEGQGGEVGTDCGGKGYEDACVTTRSMKLGVCISE